MPLIILASPKGGVGKTTLTANLAEQLRRQGRDVLLVDLDPQNALRLHFGVPIQDGSGFMAERQHRPDWRQHLRRTASGVLLLPHGAMELRAALDLAIALDRDPALLATPLREMLADPGLLVLADLPPGPSQVLQVAAPLASVIVTVLQSEAISAAMLGEVESGRFLGGGTLGALSASRLHYVLNSVDFGSPLSRASAEAVARHLGPKLLGAVSRDEALGEALAHQRPLLDLSPAGAAAQDLRQIAAGLDALVPASPSFPAPQPVPAPVAHAFHPPATPPLPAAAYPLRRAW
ncbi:cellulose biosynthesis protein BcsQ [Pseudoroseomonas globiformis]|uniref:Cellulose biosynthesis protein BcsQ n=1 Tax=Teichococcus globiformis TaxID=2307229 RepID=A0ABV7G1Z5_9PROT